MPEKAPEAPERKRFSPEEDEKLMELKEDYNLSWAQIAEFFPGRKSGTLQVRYCTRLKAKPDIDWDKEMDDRLVNLVKEYDRDKWKLVATRFGPNVNAQMAKQRWTEIEDLRDLEAVEGPHDHEATR